MAVTITSNRKNTSAVIHVASANATLVVAGNSSVSDVAIGDETLTGAYITQMYWGIDPAGYAVVKRDSTTVAVYDSTGYKDYAGCGMPLSVGQSGNISVEFVGTSNAYLLFEVQKVGDFVTEYMQN